MSLIIEGRSNNNNFSIYQNNQDDFEQKIESLEHLHLLRDCFPPDSLLASDRIKLGILVLKKFGETKFAFYQQTYRLSKEEHKLIFEQAGDYKKGLNTWGLLNEATCKEEIDVVRKHFPEAVFYNLMTTEENSREHPIAQILDKKYYFYSQAYKGPIVDESYIAQYLDCQNQENRPDFLVLRGENGKIVFCMEFMGEQTPNLRDQEDLRLLVDLIVSKSLNKKMLDMLPCRLALGKEKVHCIDQKISYGVCNSEIEAFRANIKVLKDKISFRGYAEEEDLHTYVDRIAEKQELTIFAKTIENIPYVFQITKIFPASDLTNEKKITLVAACLQKFGTKDLLYFASVYGLSVEEKNAAMQLAGNSLKENIVIWDTEIPERFQELKEKAEGALYKQGIQGVFAAYLNCVGNYKDVLTVAIGEDIYVVSEVKEEYVEQFKRQKEREHRPDFISLPWEGENFIFLSKFMGPQVVDYSNPRHLDLVVDLALNFSESDRHTIDFNYGNIVIKDDQIYYIDKDLTYSHSNNPQKTNVKGIFQSIKETLFTAHEIVKSEKYVKDRIKSSLSSDSPQELEILQKLFPKEAQAKKRVSLFERFVQTFNFENSDDIKRLWSDLSKFFISQEDLIWKNDYKALICSKLLALSGDKLTNEQVVSIYQIFKDRIDELTPMEN